MAAESTTRSVFARTSRLLHLEAEPLKDETDLPRVAERGLPVAVLDGLVVAGIPKAAVDDIIPDRTLRHRRNADQPLTRHESEGAVNAALVLSLAETVFGNREKALKWLKAPKRFLGGRAPFEMLGNGLAMELVRGRLIRIDEGYFA